MKLLSYCFSLLFLLLELQFSNAKWLCQHDYGINSGNSITFRDDVDSEGCIFKTYPISEGNHYFELKVENTDDDIAVGVTTDDALTTTNPFKGFFYDSDLTDGNKVLREGFGEIIDYNDEFDSVGVIVKMHSGKMDIYLIHAGVSLGLAFSIQNPPSTLYPALLVYGSGTITFIQKEASEIPEILDRSSHIVDGSYQVSQIKEGNKEKKMKCLHKKILFTSVYFGHSVNRGNDEDVAFKVSVNNGKLLGTLSKGNGQWHFTKQNSNAAQDGSEASECVKFVESVLQHVQSLEKTDQKVVVSGQQKSFEALKIEENVPKPVTVNVFDDSNNSFG